MTFGGPDSARNKRGVRKIAQELPLWLLVRKLVPLGFSWGNDDVKYLFNKEFKAGESHLGVTGVTVYWTREMAFWPGNSRYVPVVRD